MKISNISDLDKVIDKSFKDLKPPSMILLKGGVGAGKTTFVRELLKKYGVKEVASPTFALHHQYKGKFAFDHFDFYRLESEAELNSTGFWDLMQAKDRIVIIEWPDKIIFDYRPAGWSIYEINIKLVNEFAGHYTTEREISIEKS